jgi:hypothetical protein
MPQTESEEYVWLGEGMETGDSSEPQDQASAPGSGGAGGDSSAGGTSGTGGANATGGTSATGGATGTGGASGTGGAGTGGAAGTGAWRTANLTWYTSYPDPGSEECIYYNGCTWAGYFAALQGQQTEEWVKANNIAAVHSKDFPTYKLKTFRLRQGSLEIDVTVYDMCADSDCDGCCTKNSASTGFLIDIEKYTAERFGTRSGIVEWMCLDC